MAFESYIAHEHNDAKTHGSLKVFRNMKSPQLDNERDIFVYLPPSYESTGDRQTARPQDRQTARYPVIYMQDGQNLFDPKTSFAGEWNVDGTLDEASEEGLEAIVVGIA